MRDRAPRAPARHRAGPDQEGGLTPAAFVGSYPTADFRLSPTLPEIALIGRSNVGKSSLLNALVGRRRLARTSTRPGKTRACNVYRVDDRWYVVDLPGYGYARASKSDRAAFRRLLERVLTQRERLIGVTWLLDIRHPPSPDDRAMADLLTAHGVPVLVALTKADKLPFGRRQARRRELARAVDVPEDQCVVTSAEKTIGITELRDAIEHVVEAE